MKKILFTLVCLACSIMNATAQSELVAALSHGGNVTAFYGKSALQKAYEEAVDGDVITLTSGIFHAVDIEKAITVRGNGWNVDTITGRYPTYINGDFTVSAPKDATKKRQLFEGVYSNYTIKYDSLVSDLHFLKCRLNDLTYNNDSITKGCFINICQSRLAGKFSLGEDCQANCLNSLIHESYSLHQTTSNFYFKNCMLLHRRVCYNDYIDIQSSTLKNCIIQLTKEGGILSFSFHSYFLHSSNTAEHCLACNSTERSDYFKNMPTQNNNISISDLSIFQSFEGTFADEIDFQLTDEAAAKYLGNDGTQVGMYGGNLPFATTPSNPQITKFKVSSKSSADGKLSVDIEVGSQQ